MDSAFVAGSLDINNDIPAKNSDSSWGDIAVNSGLAFGFTILVLINLKNFYSHSAFYREMFF